LGRILLNNFLYDLSQLTIRTDNVDTSYVAKPRKWDMAMVQRFMFGLGPVGSVFDFLTLGLMLWVYSHAKRTYQAPYIRCHVGGCWSNHRANRGSCNTPFWCLWGVAGRH
jgi:hypothetical protein